MNGGVPSCRYFLVAGRVQGVFFRAATEAKAAALGITGWVRNRADGAVELVACGSDGALDELEAWLWQGPAAARVESVQSEPAEPQRFHGFRVER